MKLGHVYHRAKLCGTRLRYLFSGRKEDRFLEERLMWIFGSPRTGSSWLAMNLLASHAQVHAWDEPYLGTMLGMRQGPDSRVIDREAARPQFVFAESHRAVWQAAVGRFVLDNVRGRYFLGAADRLVIKEPNGGVGADLLLAALPHSRVLFLMRDPRDVLDSKLDMHRPDSWNPRPVLQTSGERLQRIETYCKDWVFYTSLVEKAYQCHAPERRMLLKYEDLRGQTATHVQRVFEFIGLPVARAWTEHVVAKHAFEALPEEAKGPGKFTRAATPGHWRKSFAPAERQAIQTILGAWLPKYGYDADDGRPFEAVAQSRAA